MAEKVKVSCTHCGTTNHYPLDSSEKKVVCGRCTSVLPKPGTVVELSPEQANSLLRNSSLPILVDFHSPTCAPCHIMHPAVENLAKRRAGELMIVKLNVDQHPEFAAAFSIQGVPTFLVMRKGNEIGRISGAMSEADFALWVANKV